jgi:hypothetical protein
MNNIKKCHIFIVNRSLQILINNISVLLMYMYSSNARDWYPVCPHSQNIPEQNSMLLTLTGLRVVLNKCCWSIIGGETHRLPNLEKNFDTKYM